MGHHLQKFMITTSTWVDHNPDTTGAMLAYTTVAAQL